MALTSRQLIRATTVRTPADVPQAVEKLAGGWGMGEVKVVELAVYETTGTTHVVVVFEKIG